MNEDQKKLIKDFVLISILINDIEKLPKVPTKEIKAVYDILKQAAEPLETIIDRVYDNSKNIRNTTFIQDLEKKFIYNIEREVKRYK